METLSLQELKVIINALEKAYIFTDELQRPEELNTASELYEEAKQAHKDLLFDQEN